MGEQTPREKFFVEAIRRFPTNAPDYNSYLNNSADEQAITNIRNHTIRTDAAHTFKVQPVAPYYPNARWSTFPHNLGWNQDNLQTYIIPRGDAAQALMFDHFTYNNDDATEKVPISNYRKDTSHGTFINNLRSKYYDRPPFQNIKAKFPNYMKGQAATGQMHLSKMHMQRRKRLKEDRDRRR
jgi:hypothetical protein